MDPNLSLEVNASDAEKPTFDLSTSKLTPEDAIKCLTGEYHVLVPTPNAKPCNNLDAYLYKSTLHSKKTSRNGASHGQSSERNSRRLSHPSDEHGASPRRKKARQDVFTKAEQIESNSGPLSHLKDRLNQVVKVVIRRRKKVPYISRVIEYKGTLTMFDKHMNIYLMDVIESFSYQRDGKLLKRGRHRDSIILRGDNVILVA